jgi:hypothetical protein
MAKTPNDNTPQSADKAPAPTEQIPAEPAPVSARAAASGGATGLVAEDEKNVSVFHRHPLATGIVAGAVAVVLVSGLTAWGVGAAVSASVVSSTSAELPMAPSTTAPTAGGTSKAATAGRLAFRATIQSIDGSSWSILTKKGKTITVTVDGATRFGTKRMSATAGSFAVGDNVIIVASRGAGGTPTAARVVEASVTGKGGSGTGTGTGTGSDTAPMPGMTDSPTT